MITEVAHLRIGESAQLRGHLVARLATGYEIDGGPALSFDEASARVAALSVASPAGDEESAREAARVALAPFNRSVPADLVGVEKLAKSLAHYAGEEGRALVAVVQVLLEVLRRRA